MIQIAFNAKDRSKNQKEYFSIINEMIETQKTYVKNLRSFYGFLQSNESELIKALGGKKNADFARDYIYSLKAAVEANEIVVQQISETFFVESPPKSAESIRRNIKEENLVKLQAAISKSIQTNTNLVLGSNAMFPSGAATKHQKSYALNKGPLNKLMNQYFKSQNQDCFSYAIMPAQRGPRFELFFSEKGILATLDAQSTQQAFSDLFFKPVSQANRDLNEEVRNEYMNFKDATITIKDVGINADNLLEKILTEQFKKQVVWKRDPKNPKNYIVFASTRLGKELPLANIAIKGSDIIMAPTHSHPLQWPPKVKDFCMSLTATLSRQGNAKGCEINTDDSSVGSELFRQGLRQDAQQMYLSKATTGELFKNFKLENFRVKILLEGSFESIMDKIQSTLSAGLIPVLTEETIKRLQDLRSQYKGERNFQFYLPPAPGKPYERQGTLLRDAQVKQLDIFYRNHIIQGEYPIERVSNNAEPLIEQVKHMLMNGYLPDLINITATHRKTIKDYINNMPYSHIEDLVNVEIRSTNINNIRAQINLALELGFVPNILHPEIVLQNKGQFVTLPNNPNGAVIVAQYKSLVGAGYSINLPDNDPVKAKIIAQLDSSLLESRNISVQLPDKSSSENRIFMLNRLNAMMKLGFVPKLNQSNFFDEFDGQPHGYTVTIEHLNPDVILRQYQFAQAHGLNVQFSDAAKKKFISKYQNFADTEPVIIHCTNPKECLRRMGEAINFGLIPKLDEASQEATLKYQASLNNTQRQKFEEVTFNLQSQKPEIVLEKIKGVIAMGLVPVLDPKDEKRMMSFIAKLFKKNREPVFIQRHPNVASLDHAIQLHMTMKKLSFKFDPGSPSNPNRGNIEDLIKNNYKVLDVDVENLAKEMDAIEQQILNKQKDDATLLGKQDYDSMVKELVKLRRKYDELQAHADQLTTQINKLGGWSPQSMDLLDDSSKKNRATKKAFSKLIGTLYSLHLSNIQRATELLKKEVVTLGKMNPDAQFLEALTGTIGRSNDTLIMGRKFTQEVSELTPKREEFSSHESTLPKSALDTLEHSMNVLKAKKHAMQKQQKSPEEELQQAKDQINKQIKQAIARFLKTHDALLTQLLPEKYKKQLSENFNKSEDPVLEIRNLWDVIYEARSLRYDKNAKVRHDNAIEYTKILNDLTALEEYGMKTRHSLKRAGPNPIQEGMDELCKQHRTSLQNSLVQLLTKDKLLPGSAEKVLQLENVLRAIEHFEFPRKQDKGVHERVEDLKNVLWDANVSVVQKKGDASDIQAMEQALKEFKKTLPKPAIPPKPATQDKSKLLPPPPPHTRPRA